MSNPTTHYSLWIPASEWPRIRPLAQEMNTPDGDGSELRWPVDPWPVEFTLEDNGDATYSGEFQWFNDAVGTSTGYDVFDRPGWTVEKFTRFALSRHSLHMLDVAGRKSPTLPALASFLQTPILVGDDLQGFHRFSFLTPDGRVATATHDGSPAVVTLARHTFFTLGLEQALALPGLTVETRGEPGVATIESRASSRQEQIREWFRAHATGRLLAPKGAELTCQDFNLPFEEDIRAERPVLAWARSSRHLYEILYPTDQETGPLELLCAVDGVLQHYIDPQTGIDRGYGAHGADWAEWIVNETVPAEQQTKRQPWDGNSTEAQLYRLEHNIVHYGEEEAQTSQFRTGLELAAWLKRALGNHNVPLTVHVLDDIGMTLDLDTMPVFERHVYKKSIDDIIRVRRVEESFIPWDGVRTWEHHEHGGDLWKPWLETVMDGADIDSYVAVNCQDLVNIRPYLLPAETAADRYSWFVVGVGETRTGILFPAADSMLHVSTDNDGASAQIVARNFSSRSRQLESETSFQSRWGHWLDDNHQLTRDEIQQGLEELARNIRKNGGK